MRISKMKLIGWLVLILLLCITISHFLSPVAIIGIPITISLATGLIVFTDNGCSDFIKAIIAYLFIGLNDIGIKLLGGGGHDYERMGWIHGMLLIGLVPCFIMLLASTLRNKNGSVLNKIGSLILFVALIGLHLLIFKKLGTED